jgi:hypothetical protein
MWRCIGAAKSLHEAMNGPLSPAERSKYECAVAALSFPAIVECVRQYIPSVSLLGD